MIDSLDKIFYYQKAQQLWNKCWDDTEILMKDIRGVEISRQLIRSVGSVSANIEEGYGRGYGKEYPRYLKISRGSARESKGWYLKSSRLLASDIIEDRVRLLDEIISMQTNAIKTLEEKNKKKNSSSVN